MNSYLSFAAASEEHFSGWIENVAGDPLIVFSAWIENGAEYTSLHAEEHQQYENQVAD